MRIRLAAALCTSLLLAGCSLPDLSDLLSFPDDSTAAAEPRAVATAAPARAAPGAPDPFCAAVAQQDAQQPGFDLPTQQRMIQRGYQQCVALYRAP